MQVKLEAEHGSEVIFQLGEEIKQRVQALPYPHFCAMQTHTEGMLISLHPETEYGFVFTLMCRRKAYGQNFLMIDDLIVYSKSYSTGKLLIKFVEILEHSAATVGYDAIIGYAAKSAYYNGARWTPRFGYKLDRGVDGWGMAQLAELWRQYPEYKGVAPEDMPKDFWRQHCVSYPVIKRVWGKEYDV